MVDPSVAISLPCVMKKLFVPVLNQVIPSYEYAIELVELVPTAIQNVPFQYTSFPDDEKTDEPNPYQLIPSYEYAIVFVPLPTAIHILGIFCPNV
jgi:hypothetical protein